MKRGEFASPLNTRYPLMLQLGGLLPQTPDHQVPNIQLGRLGTHTHAHTHVHTHTRTRTHTHARTHTLHYTTHTTLHTHKPDGKCCCLARQTPDHQVPNIQLGRLGTHTHAHTHVHTRTHTHAHYTTHTTLHTHTHKPDGKCCCLARL